MSEYPSFMSVFYFVLGVICMIAYKYPARDSMTALHRAISDGVLLALGIFLLCYAAKISNLLP